MDLRRSQEELAFRAEVRRFLDASLPRELRYHNDGAYHSTREETLAWQRILFERGWAAPHWPKVHGGTGWTAEQRLIFDIECAAAGAPWINQQGMGLLGPVVNAFGTPEQKERFIPALLRGDIYWCQGFSEPGSGSDLASLRTAARQDGDRYFVSGQKIWTSHAHHADWIFMLVRTAKGARKQEGISFMAAPMNTPGITVRQIDCIDGLEHLCEVFFDEVEIPAHNVIGEPGQGWAIAKHLLENERVSGACDLPGMLRDLGRLKRAIVVPSRGGRTALDEPAFAYRLARVSMEAEAAIMSYLNAIATDNPSTAEHPEIGNILKVKVTELHQKVVELLFDVLGDRGPLFYPSPMHADEFPPEPLPGLDLDLASAASEIMYRRGVSIHGGTNEIQREIIAKAVFG